MICILSKDYSQLNIVLGIIQSKLVDNDYKDIYNKYNGTNVYYYYYYLIDYITISFIK